MRFAAPPALGGTQGKDEGGGRGGRDDQGPAYQPLSGFVACVAVAVRVGLYLRGNRSLLAE